MELDLSSRLTAIPSSVCACSLERFSALSVSWLKYPIDNSSNHVLEWGLELCTISNDVLSLMHSHPGTWFGIIAECLTAKYQNSRLTCFSVINYCAIWIIVPQVRSVNPFEDWRPAGAARMLEPFEIIDRREFPLINFQSKLEWNLWGRRPASGLNNSNANVIDVDDNDYIP